MGCCLLSLLVTLGPRLVLLFIWLFTARITLAFDGFLVPLVGFLFFPMATFAYAILWSPVDGLSTAALIAVALAFVTDVAVDIGTIYGNRSRLLSSTD